jgi:hypothetical protein
MLKSKIALGLFVCLMWTTGSNTFCQKQSIKKISYSSKDRYDQVTRSWVHLFDSKGKHVESMSYDLNGKLISGAAFFYNEKGNMIKETSKMLQNYQGIPDSSGCITYYFYDSKGHYLHDSSEVFNDAFCLPALLMNGDAGDKVVYNTKDSIIEVINYNAKNKKRMSSRTVYAYDSSGSKILTMHFYYNNNGSIKDNDSTLHFYSETGFLKRDTSFHFQSDSVMYIGVDYDKYGNELQRRRYQTMKIGKKTPKNLPIVFQSDHAYIYDKWGTWIEKKYKTSRGMMAEKITRTIEYY